MSDSSRNLSFSVEGSPSAAETAAAIAAVERFLHDTTVSASASAPGRSGWLRAALYGGVGSRDPHQVW